MSGVDHACDSESDYELELSPNHHWIGGDSWVWDCDRCKWRLPGDSGTTTGVDAVTMDGMIQQAVKDSRFLGIHDGKHYQPGKRSGFEPSPSEKPPEKKQKKEEEDKKQHEEATSMTGASSYSCRPHDMPADPLADFYAERPRVQLRNTCTAVPRPPSPVVVNRPKPIVIFDL